MEKLFFIGILLMVSRVGSAAPPILPGSGVIVASTNHWALGSSNARKIVRDSRGWLYIAYLEVIPYGGGPCRVICMRSTDDGWNWSRMKVVTENDSAMSYSIAVSRGDTLHVVWERYWDFTPDTIGKDVYWRWAKDTVWGPVVNLSNGHWIGQRGTLDPSIATDTSGVIHLACRYVTTPWAMHYLRREGGIWRDTSFGYDGALPQLTVDDLGQVHLVYTRPSSVFYRKRSISGVWGPEELVCDSLTLIYTTAPTVVVGQDIHPRVLYSGIKVPMENGRVFFSERLSSGNWSSPVLISPYSNVEWHNWPSATTDTLNRLWGVWRHYDTLWPGHEWIHGRRYDGSAWDSLNILTDTSLECDIASVAERPWNAGADVVFERDRPPSDSAYIMYGWWPFSPSGVEVGRPAEPRTEGLKLSFRSPVRSQLVVRYFLPQSKIQNPKSKISLYDVSGRMVAALNEGVKPSGWHERKVPLNLPSGVYFLRLEAGKSSLTRKFVLFR